MKKSCQKIGILIIFLFIVCFSYNHMLEAMNWGNWQDDLNIENNPRLISEGNAGCQLFGQYMSEVFQNI